MTTVNLSCVPLGERPSWKALEIHFQTIGKTHLRELFAKDPARGAKLPAEPAGLFLD